VEDVLGVDLPGAAEGLPGVVLDRPHQRGRAGVEHQRPRAVLLDEPTGDDRVGDVGGDRRERVPEPGPYVVGVARARQARRYVSCTASSASCSDPSMR
jgi:hypothetical protein